MIFHFDFIIGFIADILLDMIGLDIVYDVSLVFLSSDCNTFICEYAPYYFDFGVLFPIFVHYIPWRRLPIVFFCFIIRELSSLL